MSIQVKSLFQGGGMRSYVVAAVSLLAIGCSESPPPEPIATISIGQARAVIAASGWLVAEGGDVNAAEFKALERGDGWSVLIVYLPARPGGHVILLLDEDLEVLEVIGGA